MKKLFESKLIVFFFKELRQIRVNGLRTYNILGVIENGDVSASNSGNTIMSEVVRLFEAVHSWRKRRE